MGRILILYAAHAPGAGLTPASAQGSLTLARSKRIALCESSRVITSCRGGRARGCRWRRSRCRSRNLRVHAVVHVRDGVSKVRNARVGHIHVLGDGLVNLLVLRNLALRRVPLLVASWRRGSRSWSA